MGVGVGVVPVPPDDPEPVLLPPLEPDDPEVVDELVDPDPLEPVEELELVPELLLPPPVLLAIAEEEEPPLAFATPGAVTTTVPLVLITVDPFLLTTYAEFVPVFPKKCAHITIPKIETPKIINADPTRCFNHIYLIILLLHIELFCVYMFRFYSS